MGLFDFLRRRRDMRKRIQRLEERATAARSTPAYASHDDSSHDWLTPTNPFSPLNPSYSTPSRSTREPTDEQLQQMYDDRMETISPSAHTHDSSVSTDSSYSNDSSYDSSSSDSGGSCDSGGSDGGCD